MFKLAPSRRTAPEQGAPIEKESDGVNGGTERFCGGLSTITPKDDIMRLSVPIALLLTALPFVAHAASFDCARAKTPDERTVCARRVLNDRDVRMSVLYGLDLRLVPMGSRDVIRRDQAAWLRQRGRCGADPVCLARVYDRRIAALQAVIDTRVYPQGPF
jgi:hypothetical protein